jgi:hypothetical protein
MYDLNVVRQICRDINSEADPIKTGNLIALLQAVLKEDREEVRLRMTFLARKYGFIGSGSETAA